MRTSSGLLTLLAIGVAGIWAAPAAHADTGYDFPVCLHVYGPVTYDDCRYSSIAQCAPSAQGRSAQCIVNPFYVPRPVRPAPARPRR